MALARNDIKQRYSGQALGVVWAFVQPMVTLAVYYFVFAVGFRASPVSGKPYILYLICGMLPWLFFCEAFSGATGAVTDYAHLLKKMSMDTRVLPGVRVLAALFTHAIFLILALAVFGVTGVSVSVFAPQVLYYTLCTAALALALGTLTACIAPFWRDIAQVVGIVLQLGFWLTPVTWNEEILGAWRWLAKLNPVFYLVSGYRDSLLHGVGAWEHPLWTLGFWLATAAIFALSRRMFRRLQPQFADVL